MSLAERCVAVIKQPLAEEDLFRVHCDPGFHDLAPDLQQDFRTHATPNKLLRSLLKNMPHVTGSDDIADILEDDQHLPADVCARQPQHYLMDHDAYRDAGPSGIMREVRDGWHMHLADLAKQRTDIADSFFVAACESHSGYAASAADILLREPTLPQTQEAARIILDRDTPCGPERTLQDAFMTSVLHDRIATDAVRADHYLRVIDHDGAGMETALALSRASQHLGQHEIEELMAMTLEKCADQGYRNQSAVWTAHVDAPELLNVHAYATESHLNAPELFYMSVAADPTILPADIRATTVAHARRRYHEADRAWVIANEAEPKPDCCVDHLFLDKPTPHLIFQNNPAPFVARFGEDALVAYHCDTSHAMSSFARGEGLLALVSPTTSDANRDAIMGFMSTDDYLPDALRDRLISALMDA